MKKLNLIIGKKHIILSALILALSVAVYLNWEYVKQNDQFVGSDGLVAVDGGTAEPSAYGEAYFAEAKLSRTKSRDEAIDALKYMLEDSTLDGEKMAELAMAATEMAKTIETEGKIENLIKAKGFQDCMVYLGEDKVDVIVRCEDMTDSEAAQIKDVILGEVTDKVISIIEIQ